MQITKQEIETMIQQAVLAGKAAADTSAKDFYKATERRLYALETLRHAAFPGRSGIMYQICKTYFTPLGRCCRR